MPRPLMALTMAGAMIFAAVVPARAEILAMVLYETMAEDSLRALRVETGPRSRRDGIAIVDVDPDSSSYGQIIADFPLPPGTASHHIYYNPDLTKAYITALWLGSMYVLDLTRAPYRMRKIEIPECIIQEDVKSFSPSGPKKQKRLADYAGALSQFWLGRQ